jgi:hypothetical protein
VAGKPSASSLRNIFGPDTTLLRIRGLVLGNAIAPADVRLQARSSSQAILPRGQLDISILQKYDIFIRRWRGS